MLQKRRLPSWTRLVLMGILICPTSEGANGQGRKRAGSPETPSRIVPDTVINGDIDPRTLRAALEALPRRPEQIVVVETKALPPGHEKQLRDMDAFVSIGSRAIYLRRQSPTLLAAEYQGGLTC